MNKSRISLIITCICSLLSSFLLTCSGVQSKPEPMWFQSGITKEVTSGLDVLIDEIAVEGYKVVPLDKAKT